MHMKNAISLHSRRRLYILYSMQFIIFTDVHAVYNVFVAWLFIVYILHCAFCILCV